MDEIISLRTVKLTIVFPMEHNSVIESSELFLVELYHDFLPKIVRFSSKYDLEFIGETYTHLPIETHTVTVEGQGWKLAGLNLVYNDIHPDKLKFVDLANGWDCIFRDLDTDEREIDRYTLDVACFPQIF